MRDFLKHPPVSWDEDIERLRATTFFLVNRIGPTVFVLKTDDLSESTYKVYIGENQRCSCGGGEGRGKLCLHIMFVMLKVLRVSGSNPCAWQLGLNDNEIEDILSESTRHRGDQAKHKAHKPFLKKGQGRCCANNITSASREKNGEEENVSPQEKKPAKQKDIEEDPTCSICQEDMTEEDITTNNLCHCATSCGSNFHRRCFRMYSTHARSERKPVLCPMCRTEWKELLPPVSASARPSPVLMRHVRCKNCKVIVRSVVFRCVSCVNPTSYDLCKRCFEGAGTLKHDHLHQFVSAAVSQHPRKWSAAVSPASKRLEHLSGLERREFTDADYNLLLSLDQQETPLHQHLIKAFPEVSQKDYSDTCCPLCSTNLSVDSSARRLPCNANHVVHVSCALGMLIEAESAVFPLGAAGVCCPVCADGAPLFPALVQKTKRLESSKRSEVSKKTSDHAKHLPWEKESKARLENAFDGFVAGTSSLLPKPNKQAHNQLGCTNVRRCAALISRSGQEAPIDDFQELRIGTATKKTPARLQEGRYHSHVIAAKKNSRSKCTKKKVVQKVSTSHQSECSLVLRGHGT